MSKTNILRIVLVFVAGAFFMWFGIQFWSLKQVVKFHSQTIGERILPVTDFVTQQILAQQKANEK